MRSPQKKPVTPASNDALRHVLYEIWMISEGIRLMREWPSVRQSRALKNALLESTLLHTRAMTEFFYGWAWSSVPSRKDDSRALDFFTRPSVNSLDPVPSYLEGINKEIAHITHLRAVDPGQKAWKLPGDIDPLLEQILVFLELIEKRSPSSGHQHFTLRNRNFAKCLHRKITALRQRSDIPQSTGTPDFGPDVVV